LSAVTGGRGHPARDPEDREDPEAAIPPVPFVVVEWPEVRLLVELVWIRHIGLPTLDAAGAALWSPEPRPRFRPAMRGNRRFSKELALIDLAGAFGAPLAEAGRPTRSAGE